MNPPIGATTPAPDPPQIPATRRIGLVPLVGLIYVLVCAGPYGMEELVSASGPGLAMLLIMVAPILWGVPMALAVAELGSAWPLLGGYYRWTRTAFGDFWGFQQGWWQLLSAWVDNALYPVLVSDYLVTLVPALAEVRLPLLLGFTLSGDVAVRLAVILGLSLVNARGVTEVGNSTLLLGLLLLVPFVPYVALGFAAIEHNPFLPLVPPDRSAFEALGLGMLIILWGYSGYEAMSTAVHEVEDPQRNLPRALFWSIPISVLSYAVPIAAGLAAYGNWETWTSGTLATAAGAIGGPWLHQAVLIGALASSLALFNAYTLSYSRLPQAMAQDRFLPAWLAKTSPRRGTPVRAIAANACVYGALAFFEFRELVVVDTILFSAAYILIFATLVRMRALYPDVERPYRIPGGRVGVWLVATVPTLAAIGACVLSDFEEIRWGLAAATTGLPAYLVVRACRRPGR